MRGLSPSLRSPSWTRISCGETRNAPGAQAGTEPAVRKTYLLGVEVAISVAVGDGDDVEVLMGAAL